MRLQVCVRRRRDGKLKSGLLAYYGEGFRRSERGYVTDKGVQHVFVEVNGVWLHRAVKGEGRPVILLHGFPEFWYSWRKQMLVLSRRFKVVAPDMKGL